VSTKLDTPDLLTPAEVARMFRVDARTVTRWAKSGRLMSTRTLGGHRRFRRADVEAAPGSITYGRTPTPAEEVAAKRATAINSALADLFDVAAAERNPSPELRMAVRAVKEAQR